MSFTPDELKNHCFEIIKDPAIRNRIVVLCEGDTKPFKQTVHATRIKEFSAITQDSAFYYRAIPTWWKDTRKLEPEFRICGTQSNVIKAYFNLLELHQENPQNSYLNPDRLFALVDIDFQKTKLPKEYPFNNLEEVYENLYFNGKVNQKTSPNHKIWVTGLLHKEAYFFIPSLQELFDNHLLPPLFNNQSLQLKDIYQGIVEAMPKHNDIRNNFTKAIKRIFYCEIFNSCKLIEEFQSIWQTAFNNSGIEEKEQLIYALLTIAKSKSAWEEIKPNAITNNAEIKTYRDDLSLKIAREFYAKQPRNSQHHIPSFFNALSAAT